MYLKSEGVKRIDKYGIEYLGIPECLLMENAGIGIVKNIDKESKAIAVVCGSGNNGGDGLVLGRHLISKGKEVSIYIIGNEDKLNNSVELNYNILKKLEVDINFLLDRNDLEKFAEDLEEVDLIVDCIFGIGLSREIEGIYKDIIEIINKSDKKVLAVDTPSGFNHSSGEIYKTCIKADKTVTFIGEKFGFQNKNAKEYTGEVVVEQISIPIDKVKEALNL